LVPDELPTGPPVAIGGDRRVDQVPEQDGLVDDLLLGGGEPLDVASVSREEVPHQQRLDEEVPEGMRPAVLLEAARERGGVPDQRDDLRVEPVGQPLRREDRDRVLEERASAPAPEPPEL